MRTIQKSFQFNTDFSEGQNRTTRNYLKINDVERHFDPAGSKLVLEVRTGETLDEEVHAFLQGNRLMLEAPCHLDFSRPYRSHLVGNRVLNNYDNEVSLIAFSEIKLKPGYHYSILSRELIDPHRVKIILRARRRSDIS